MIIKYEFILHKNFYLKLLYYREFIYNYKMMYHINNNYIVVYIITQKKKKILKNFKII